MVCFEKVIKRLNLNKVEYIIVGGLAATIHGASYITNDIDICYNRSKKNYQNIINALSSLNVRLRGPDSTEFLPFIFDIRTLENGMNFTFLTDLGDIDILGELSGVKGYANLLPQSEEIELFSEKCRVISLDDLMTAKKAAGRNKDLLLLDQLEALKELKKSKT